MIAIHLRESKMSRRFTLALTLAAVVLAMGWSLSRSHAADEAPPMPAARNDLQVVTYSSGLTGFFDPSSDTLYIYASDLKTPFMTVKVETLGEPLKVVQGPKQ